jgi:uncharacterized protein YPO0396
MPTSYQMNKPELAPDNTLIGFRLQYMELLNWGTFHDRIWKIEPNGNNSLLTGSIGSGKSTIVDALTSLIVPHQKITFNKAAGAENKERNLLSYIKGNFSSKSDEIVQGGKAVSLRYKDASDTTFTVVLANFVNTGFDTNVTLVQVFWIENEKPQKLLAISNRPLTIKEYFTNIEDVKELRKRLKHHSFIEVFDDNFSQYSQRFRQLFGMNSDKAIDLFNQTVSMKSVSSLTSFVRDQMLERTDIKYQIEDLKKRFDDLNKAYAAVQEARKQRDILKPLIELSGAYRKFEDHLQLIDAMVQSIPGYFATKKMDLLSAEIADCERKLLQITGSLHVIENTLNEKRDAQNQIKQDIRNNGGARLEQIAQELREKEKYRDHKKDKHQVYTALTAFCGLETANTDKTFFRNLRTAEQNILDLSSRQQEIFSEHGKLSGSRSSMEEIIETQTKELESLRSRENQIPLEFVNIRKQLATDLEIAEEVIPFAGELMKVNEHEKDWEGAIERLLRGFGLSLLVPEKYYHQVSQYINARRLTDNRNKGMRFEYFKVPYQIKSDKFQMEPDVDSIVNKIDIRPNTPFEAWLETELHHRFNLRGVSMEEFQRQRDVITKEGQVKTGSQRHVKDDRRDLWDRKNFVLGWSNKDKISAIEKHLQELKADKDSIQTKIGNLKSEMDNNTRYQTKLNQIIGYKDWNEINWQEEAKRITELEREREDLQISNNVLQTLQEQLSKVQKEIETLEQHKSEALQLKGKMDQKILDSTVETGECRKMSGPLTPQEKETIYPQIEADLKELALTIRNVDKTKDNLLKIKNDDRKNTTEKQNRIRDKIIKQMREYKNQYPSDSLELSDEIEARHEYLGKLENILKDGLPAHEARFKKMLNENTINDIVAFDNKLDMHEKSIREKISIINQHLKEIIYDKNKETYIKLLAERNPDPEISNFKKQLKACYSNIFGTDDAYTEDRFNEVQQILNRFRSNSNSDIEWTNKVTDVRNWFNFNARENYLSNDEEYQFYAGSSGKSGGQKEKLAYTILASALAYQFGLTYGEPKSKTFRFVVIDEAFGRGDDESTQFGLGLFKKLNLQLLIVTPLQKIHVIENYINSVHYVSNTEGNNSELLNLTVEEYKTGKRLHNVYLNSMETTEVSR